MRYAQFQGLLIMWLGHYSRGVLSSGNGWLYSGDSTVVSRIASQISRFHSQFSISLCWERAWGLGYRTGVFLMPFCLCRKEHKSCEFELHEAYAIDIIISTGEGKVSRGQILCHDAYTSSIKCSDKEFLFLPACRHGSKMLGQLFTGRQTKGINSKWKLLEVCMDIDCNVLTAVIACLMPHPLIVCTHTLALSHTAFFTEISNKFTVMPFSLRYV